MDSRLQRLKEAQNQNLPEKAGAGASTRRQRFTAQVISSSNNLTELKEEEQVKRTNLEESTELTVANSVESADSSSDSSSSDDEELQKLIQRPNKPVLKPVFISKEDRASEKASDKMTFSTSKDTRNESRAIVAEILRKEFENAHDTSKNVPDALTGAFRLDSVDDKDDPNNFEEEYLAWRLRELLRIREERDEREAYEREKEEIERIRNMTEEERRKIDQEKMEEWMSQPKSQYKFLQKYYHKGAFYQDEHKEILSRDYAQATGLDRSDKDVLPEILQVRDFGKKGKGKWKHLTAEDTTAFDYGWGAKDNSVNFSSISKMGGMKGDLDNPSKKHKK